MIEARALSRRYPWPQPWWARLRQAGPRPGIQAVADLSLDLAEGRTLALVGESGCGKTTVGRMLVGLETPDAGEVRVDGQPLHATLSGPAGPALALRRRLQMVFQDPQGSLDPRWRVGDAVAEPLLEHRLCPPAEVPGRVAALMEAVGLSPDDMPRWPHQFSGGQRQRVSIARALASEPRYLICDEPTSALDVSVQAQVLNLLVDLQAERRLGLLFISHDLAVVRYVADQVAVMYLGRLVEQAPKATLFAMPRHPYTRLLLGAAPDLGLSGRARTPVPGDLPDPMAVPGGCAFHPRCPHAQARCRDEIPAWGPADGGQGDAPVPGLVHRVACHLVADGRL